MLLQYALKKEQAISVSPLSVFKQEEPPTTQQGRPA